jgi:nucleotide-binding universal stress UspA family protein
VRVLVALDTSDVGETAVAVIGAWAGTMLLEVTLLSVVHGDETRQNAERSTSRAFVAPEASGAGAMLAVGGSLYVDDVGGDPSTVEDHGQALVRARSEREAYLRAVAARHLPDAKATVQVEFSDDTAQAIVAAAQSLGVDAIALATHGRSGLRHVVMGSVAEAVTRQSPVPVIVIGPQAHAAHA